MNKAIVCCILVDTFSPDLPNSVRVTGMYLRSERGWRDNNILQISIPELRTVRLNKTTATTSPTLVSVSLHYTPAPVVVIITRAWLQRRRIDQTDHWVFDANDDIVVTIATHPSMKYSVQTPATNLL